MKRSEFAASLAARLLDDLHSAEASQDDAVSRLGQLAQALTRTRREAGLSSTVGQAAFDALADAVAAQVQAQRAMVALHGALADVKQRTAFRNISLSGYDKEEDPKPRTIGRLALVS